MGSNQSTWTKTIFMEHRTSESRKETQHEEKLGLEEKEQLRDVLWRWRHNQSATRTLDDIEKWTEIRYSTSCCPVKWKKQKRTKAQSSNLSCGIGTSNWGSWTSESAGYCLHRTQRYCTHTTKKKKNDSSDYSRLGTLLVRNSSLASLPSSLEHFPSPKSIGGRILTS